MLISHASHKYSTYVLSLVIIKIGHIDNGSILSPRLKRIRWIVWAAENYRIIYYDIFLIIFRIGGSMLSGWIGYILGDGRDVGYYAGMKMYRLIISLFRRWVKSLTGSFIIFYYIKTIKILNAHYLYSMFQG